MEKLNETFEQKTDRLVREAHAEKPTIYAKFHFKYLNFEFKEKTTGKIYTKGNFWDAFRGIAMSLPTNKESEVITPSGFLLVDCSYRFKNISRLLL